jgi:hypothetical protein
MFFQGVIHKKDRQKKTAERMFNGLIERYGNKETQPFNVRFAHRLRVGHHPAGAG